MFWWTGARILWIVAVMAYDVSFSPHPDARTVLAPAVVAFLTDLHDGFDGRRADLLAERARRQVRFDGGERPNFLTETATVRSSDWMVAAAPKGLVDRRVEITGPVERKLMVNALNSGARVFMADLEDATSPTWENMMDGHVNLIDAVRGSIEVTTPGRTYRLGGDPATLVVRPRGWHLVERHFRVNGVAMSASLFDVGLYLFHNGVESLARGGGPYLYLPKLEGHLEARLWNDVFCFIEDALGLGRGAIRVTVLIETITAAFEMDEILYELRDHICGLNAGRWDYIFSIAKRFHTDLAFVLPDRAAVTMTTPFMRAYSELLVKTCHRRGAHAIGGMAAFIPNRRKPEVTDAAVEKVAEDKRREAGDGFDGTWVAHPDLVATAAAEFDAVLGEQGNQLERHRPDVHVDATQLLAVTCPPGSVTRAGLETNISVGLRYLIAWLSGTGAAAIDDLMEDAATAEISRAQVWQWVHHKVRLADGTLVTAELVRDLLDRIAARLAVASAAGDATGDAASLVADARTIFESVALDTTFVPFLTLPAYELLP
jgi:malate synthase